MTAYATFAMGCFWKPELLFSKAPGVQSTAVGFMGGALDNPSYEQVCADRTGHAEVVHIEYDSNQVSYESLLKLFWENHNPTQVNRQGVDVGTQYRSVIFYHDKKQRQAAEKSKAELASSGKFDKPIATDIKVASTFYRAERYHQKYLEKRGLDSCPI